MLHQISNEIMAIIVQAIISVAGVLATAVMTVLIQYINKKKEHLVTKIGADTYNHIYNVAKATFFAVEQNFIGTNGMIDQKKKMFDTMLLQKMPHLTQQELNHYSDAITGEINHQLKLSGILSPSTVSTEVPSINTNQYKPEFRSNCNSSGTQ